MKAHWTPDANIAYLAAQQPWGGATLDRVSGHYVYPDHGYAVTDRSAGDTILLAEDASLEDFEQALSEAREQYGTPYVGVFHDSAEGQIQLDPTRIVPSTDEVDAIYTESPYSGGAYDFATGNGYWPN